MVKRHENTRNANIDLVKLIAAFGVITIHVPFRVANALTIGNFFSPFCVPFFFVTSLVFFVGSLPKRNAVGEVYKQILKRIIIPYLAWTIVYFLFIIIKDVATGTHHTFVYWQIIFYGETAAQLYYLPELVMLQSFAFSLYIVLFKPADRLKGLLIFAIAAGYMWFGYVNHCFGVMTLSRLIFYLAIAFLLTRNAVQLMSPLKFLIAGSLIMMGMLLEVVLKFQNPVLQYLFSFPIGGVGLFLLTLGMPKFSYSKLAIILISTSYGIYLSHIVFLESFEFAIKKLTHNHIKFDLKYDLWMSALVFTCAVIFTLIARKIKIIKQTLLGEGNLF